MYSRPRSGSTGSNGSSFSSASVLVPPPLHVQHLSSNASQTRIVETTDRDQYVPSHYNRMRRRHHAHYAKLIPSSSHTYGTTGIDPREHEMSIDFNARAKQPPQPNLNVQNSHNPHPNNLMQLQTEVKGFPNNGAEQDNRGQDMEVHQPHDQTMPQSSYGQRRQLPLQKENEHQTGKIGTSSCYQATIVHHGNKDDDQTTPVQETARQVRHIDNMVVKDAPHFFYNFLFGALIPATHDPGNQFVLDKSHGALFNTRFEFVPFLY